MRHLLVLFTLLAPSTALAEITSTYTSFEFEACKEVTPGNPDEGYSGDFICPGYKDNQISFAEGDLRQLIAYGKNPETHCARRFSFPNFNSVGKTIEWRLKDGEAFAVIHRWTISREFDAGPKESTWLVVNKLEPDNSCFMAIVEGAYPKANEKAREIADSKAPGFACETGEIEVIARAETDKDAAPSGPSCMAE